MSIEGTAVGESATVAAVETEAATSAVAARFESARNLLTATPETFWAQSEEWHAALCHEAREVSKGTSESDALVVLAFLDALRQSHPDPAYVYLRYETAIKGVAGFVKQHLSSAQVLLLCCGILRVWAHEYAFEHSKRYSTPPHDQLIASLDLFNNARKAQTMHSVCVAGARALTALLEESAPHSAVYTRRHNLVGLGPCYDLFVAATDADSKEAFGMCVCELTSHCEDGFSPFMKRFPRLIELYESAFLAHPDHLGVQRMGLTVMRRRAFDSGKKVPFFTFKCCPRILSAMERFPTDLRIITCGVAVLAGATFEGNSQLSPDRKAPPSIAQLHVLADAASFLVGRLEEGAGDKIPFVAGDKVLSTLNRCLGLVADHLKVFISPKLDVAILDTAWAVVTAVLHINPIKVKEPRRSAVQCVDALIGIYPRRVDWAPMPPFADVLALVQQPTPSEALQCYCLDAFRYYPVGDADRCQHVLDTLVANGAVGQLQAALRVNAATFPRAANIVEHIALMPRYRARVMTGDTFEAVMVILNVHGSQMARQAQLFLRDIFDHENSLQLEIPR